jgi:DNA-binding SARP family transcriptional activator
MDKCPPARIQLCGRFSVQVGDQVVHDLRGRQCRPLLGYLVLHRTRSVTRAELIDALWGEQPPPAADTALSALLSNLRKAFGWEMSGRGEIRLALPAGSFVDAEAAIENSHLAQAAEQRGDATAAYICAEVARYICRRTFLVGFDAPWIEEWRTQLAEVNVTALETFARACLTIGGGELAAADRATRELVRFAPYRETGHALRMRALAAAGNTAEALLAFDRLCHLLRDDLGVSPSPDLRALHQELLTATTAD